MLNKIIRIVSVGFLVTSTSLATAGIVGSLFFPSLNLLVYLGFAFFVSWLLWFITIYFIGCILEAFR